MEEKERFSIGIINGILYLYDNFNKYNTEITLKDLSDLLNQQDKRIKELEGQLKQLKFDCAMYKSANHLINEVGIDKAREIMFQSEEKLKQSQNSFIVEFINHIFDIFEFYENANNDTIVQPYNNLSLFEYLQKVLKSFKGSNN